MTPENMTIVTVTAGTVANLQPIGLEVLLTFDLLFRVFFAVLNKILVALNKIC
jgi:hypothetical protein